MRRISQSCTATFRILKQRVIFRALTHLLWLVVAAPAFADHAKTDVVTTDDGNTFIGEIKIMAQANLTLDTDAGGTLDIEWRRVTSLTSAFEYRVELTGGLRYYGTLGRGKKTRQLMVVTASDPVEVELDEVFSITPIASNFWKSLDGALNFGATYTQSNQSLQYNVSGNVTRRLRRGYTTLSGQSIFNTQEGSDATTQYQLQAMAAQFGKNRWGLFELGELQSNPALGYDLRLVLGGGVSNFLVEDSWRLLTVNAGIVYNRENVTGDSDVDSSAEALVSLGYQHFKRSSHSPVIQFGFATFTNINGDSRFRGALNFNISWKIVGGVTFSVQLTDSYDSRPPGTDSQNNDLTIVTSFGYSF